MNPLLKIVSHPVLFWCALIVLQTTIVLALGLVVSRCFRRDASTRHAVLLATLAVLFVSPLLLLGLELTGWTLWEIAAPTTTTGLSTPPVEVASGADVPPSLERTAAPPLEPFIENPEPSAEVDVAPHMAGARAAPGPAQQASRAEPSRRPIGWTMSADHVLPLFLAIWVAGGLLVLFRFIYGMLQVRSLCRRAVPADDPKVADAAASLAGVHRSRVRWRLLASPEIGTAFATGLLRPTIVLPRRYIAMLTSDELLLVLMHESAHLVRRDLIVAILQRLATVMYWPHPLFTP